MHILTARRYISPRTRALSLEEQETRRLAYAIKSIASPGADFATAAREMAALVLADPLGSPCWLVPIPASTGDLAANTRLCAAIAILVPGAQVVRAILRTAPIQSQCARHRLALGPITAADHHFKRAAKPLSLRQTYLVDNVTTSGHTLQAAHEALGFGTGLVFADAANRRTQIQATLF